MSEAASNVVEIEGVYMKDEGISIAMAKGWERPIEEEHGDFVENCEEYDVIRL